jgi:hypothetical protein
VYAYVTVPIAAYRPLELRHRWLLQVLVGFADATGKCWPALRTVAAEAGHHVSWVQRNMAELVELGCSMRKRRGRGSFLYQIAERFLPPRRVGNVSKTPADEPSLERYKDPAPMSHRQTLNVSPVGTEGLPKEESEEDSKREGGPVRLTPPVEGLALPSPQKPAGRPAEGPNPHARRQWLRTLNGFIGERLTGPQQWGGWEVVIKAMNGDTLAPDARSTASTG